MLPSIRQILESDPVQRGEPTVVAGHAELDRPVRWVHVSEVADLTALLTGGELVLTTGVAMTDPAAADEYLRGLQEAGAVGLIVELGPQITAVDPAFRRAADELRFPLIALAKETRFVDVTEAAHRLIVAEQYDAVVFAHRAHEVFSELTMTRASMAEIVSAAGRLLDLPVVLEDLNHHVLTVAAATVPTSQLLRDWSKQSRLTPWTRETARSGPESWLVTPVGPQRRHWGRLVMPGPDTAADSAEARMVLERAAQALTLWRMVEQAEDSLEQQAQSSLLDDLRRGRITDEGLAMARASTLGLQPSITYIPMTVRLTGAPRTDQVVAQRRLAQVLDATRRAVVVQKQTALVADRQGRHVDLLLSQPPGADIDLLLTRTAAEIRAALLRLDGIADCAIGVAAASPRLVDAAAELAESAHIAEVAIAMPRDPDPLARPYHRAADVRLRGLLYLLADDPRVKAFAETELRGILDHRVRHDDDAYDILRAYLAAGGNKSELAKTLHMSRPTLYARLATLSRILGVDLEDAESRTSLHTALLIMDAVERRP
ncbi:MAG: PucR family transcriptional regulator [Gordonia sp. (in: high G+C Gram-positive bacteria)]|uniref:PucR family transcriptional regulator n=1 Tax=Gordonia sp. (in: high G+C Gram-positive bacteria) TaxID=84139 RepID=UPI0039E2AD76